MKIEGCDLVILKSRSPSCGSGEIYDGSFSGNTYQMVVTDLHTLLQIGDYGMREVRLK